MSRLKVLLLSEKQVLKSLGLLAVGGAIEAGLGLALATSNQVVSEAVANLTAGGDPPIGSIELVKLLPIIFGVVIGIFPIIGGTMGLLKRSGFIRDEEIDEEGGQK